MAMIVYDCPRCKAISITFDVLSGVNIGSEYGWKKYYELFCQCRHCLGCSVLMVCVAAYDRSESVSSVKKILETNTSLNLALEVQGYLSLKDFVQLPPPEHLPSSVKAAFEEGALCLTVGCYNASGAMFRLAIDLATKGLLPDDDATIGGANRQQRKQLHERLSYLFDSGLLLNDLRQLAECVKDDGNDGAHDGTLGKADAEDLLDFATRLFERMFTEPKKLRLAKQRRDERRQQ